MAGDRGGVQHLHQTVEEEEDHGSVRVPLRDSHDIQVIVFDVHISRTVLQPHGPLISLLCLEHMPCKAFNAIHWHIPTVVSRNYDFSLDIEDKYRGGCHAHSQQGSVQPAELVITLLVTMRQASRHVVTKGGEEGRGL